ncbi:nitroreductase/quinone reductase family protein [Actinoplanes sp. NPDC051861]|uniref:nitroreductase/quinone reductase family protein n=1 Tax=Actinoplanes sp. NPDC051861 TaxID=3155170 RepID=UPI003443D1ED
MSFDTRAGTRGARQPKGWFLAWFNRRVVRRARKGGTGDTIVLITVGRRTGAERQTPVRGFPEKGGGWLIVASSAGSAGNPAWYHNLAANPGQVRVLSGGHTVDVTAEQLHDPDRERAWRRITGDAPRFGEYQEKTDRVLPVIRLTPA